MQVLHSEVRRVSIAILALALFACSGSPPPDLTSPIALKGAGASFPAPAYKQWAKLFKDQNKRANITYEASSSAEGIEQLKTGSIDFAGIDKPLTDAEFSSFAVRPVQIPILVSGIVPVYNVPGVKQTIKFTGAVLARIYLGIIREWNDPDLVDLNPGLNLPPLRIAVIHRSDESGTTYVFTKYLSMVNDRWKQAVGEGEAVNWPVGTGAAENEGVVQAVKSTPNALGYVDLPHAVTQNLTFGPIKNNSGKYVKASLPSITNAADSIKDIPADFNISLIDMDSEDAYPVTTFTWLLLPGKVADAQKRAMLKEFLRYTLEQGQFKALDLEYGTLPQRMAQKATDALRNITGMTAAAP